MANSNRIPAGEGRIRLVQHIPGFVDCWAQEVAEADDQAGLLAVPWVASYSHNNNRFHRYSLSRNQRGRPMLMVEQDEGRHWWVVGYIDHGVDLLDLPDWKPLE